jgi:hypothetical protein
LGRPTQVYIAFVSKGFITALFIAGQAVFVVWRYLDWSVKVEIFLPEWKRASMENFEGLMTQWHQPI